MREPPGRIGAGRAAPLSVALGSSLVGIRWLVVGWSLVGRYSLVSRWLVVGW